MKTFQKTLLASALGLGALQAAPAYAVVFLPEIPVVGAPGGRTGLHDLELINRENIYRASGSCTDTTCLPFNAAIDPQGYQRPNPAIPDNVLVGDLFIGVTGTRSILNGDGLTSWNEDNAAPGIDTFTGYFVQEVKGVALNVTGAGGALDRIILGGATVLDPFGILNIAGADGNLATLADNVLLGSWVDNGTPYLIQGAGLTVFQSIASATDGTLWGLFGVGANTPGTAAVPGFDGDGYFYSEVEISGALANFAGNFYSALNLLQAGPALTIGLKPVINDPIEGTVGGSLLGDPGPTGINNYFGVCAPSSSYACNQLVGNGQLGPNQSVVSPWTFSSEDPLQLYATPEPATLALMAFGLMGLGGLARRRA
jgi:hypothetical protein